MTRQVLALLISIGVSLLVSLFGTPLLIRFLTAKSYGQFIRQDGPTAHFTKRGTPTMGGIVIILATVIAYFAAHFVTVIVSGTNGFGPKATGLLVLFLMVGLGVVGFLDDFIKISRQRSLGLKPMWKFIGQGVVGVSFAVLALQFPGWQGLTPGSTRISVTRDTAIDLAVGGLWAVGLVLFVLWANFLITAWSNAVNLTDGLDGLATGASVMVFGAYCVVGVWQNYASCRPDFPDGCYMVRDPLDVAILAGAIFGACFGFLWWNASPARIFMGDTGALALGGALAGLSIVSRTEILAALIGGLFVIIVMSDVIQIGWFKLTGRRVFKMAPLHHHFELSGWGEVTIVIRFWIIAGLFVALGIGLFLAEWITAATFR